MKKLAFYTRRNLTQMIALFRQSGLGKRAKMATRRGGKDYVRYTAERACKQQKTLWKSRKADPAPSSEQRRSGRPKCQIDPESVRELRDAGMSWRRIAATLSIGKTTAKRLYDAVSCVPKVSQNHEVNRSAPDPPEACPKHALKRDSSSGAYRSAHPQDEKDAGVQWEDWKARELNRLFEEQGVTGRPGKITAAVVRHGLREARSQGDHVPPKPDDD